MFLRAQNKKIEFVLLLNLKRPLKIGDYKSPRAKTFEATMTKMIMMKKMMICVLETHITCEIPFVIS